MRHRLHKHPLWKQYKSVLSELINAIDDPNATFLVNSSLCDQYYYKINYSKTLRRLDIEIRIINIVDPVTRIRYNHFSRSKIKTCWLFRGKTKIPYTLNKKIEILFKDLFEVNTGKRKLKQRNETPFNNLKQHFYI